VGDARLGDGYSEEAIAYYQQAYGNDPTSFLGLAAAVRAALQIDNVPLASRLLAMASAEQHETFEYLVDEGVLALRNLDYEGARRAFEQAGRRKQESPRLHVGLGFLALREGNRESAQWEFARAVKVATDPMEAIYDIVDVCRGGYASDARPYAEQLVSLSTQAIAADPGQSNLYATRAMAYQVLGEQSLAYRDLETQRSLLGWWEGADQLPAAALGAP
jgi:tetratricopeptide (TPR) repeat protein